MVYSLLTLGTICCSGLILAVALSVFIWMNTSDRNDGNGGDESCFNIDACNLHLNYLINRENNFSILSLNINSLRGKISELRAFISLARVQFAFIVITEIKLTSVTDLDLELEGYKSISLYRTEFGGGIKIFYLEYLNVVCNDDQNLTGLFDTHESLFISCLIPKYKKIILGAFYRPPGASRALFVGGVEQILSRIHRSDTVVICGDFNLNMLEVGLPGPMCDFNNLMISFGMKNYITLPTYIIPKKTVATSVIDHVWSNVSTPVWSYVVSPPLSDHLSCVAVFDIKIPVTLNKVEFRDKSVNKQQYFNCMIEDEYFDYNSPIADAEICVKHFDGWFQNITNKYFPVKKKFISTKRLNSPWLTTRLIKCIRNKHWLFQKFKQNIITYEMYQMYCKLLKLTLMMAEQNCYRNRFRDARGNSSKCWKILNTMLGKNVKDNTKEFLINNELTKDSQIIADSFGGFFHSVPNIVKQGIIKPNADLLNCVSINARSMFLFPAKEKEIEGIIKSLKSSNEKFEWSTFVLKLGVTYFARIIKKLFNQCIRESVYPSILKIARITPIFKKGRRALIENYRPISVLPVLNKIFEKLIFKRLDFFVESTNVLSDCQHGFRKGRSTDTASLELIRCILPAFKEGSYALCVFLDQSKAFDLVEHALLLEKLNRLGVRGPCLELMKSYLSDRTFYVAYESKKSNCFALDSSVPQGSVGGPILFNLYSNDLTSYIKDLDIVLYADDSVFILVGSNITTLFETMNQKLSQLDVWCRFNGLHINAEKTKYMIFTNKQEITTNLQLKINNREIELVESIKYLGLVFDHKLNFGTQIDSLYKRLTRCCGITYRISDNFTPEIAKTYYYSYTYSLLCYGIAVYGGNLINSFKISKFQKCQDKIILTLFQKHYTCNSLNELYQVTSILKIKEIFKLKAGIFMHQMVHDNLHVKLYHSISIDDHTSRDTRGNDNLSIRTIFPRVNAIKYSFQYQFCKIWNDIPIEIKTINNFKKFKKLYSSHLLATYAITE